MAHQVVLTWAAPDDVVASSTYNIYRTGSLCTAAGTDGLVFKKVNVAPVTALTFVDTTVVVGGSYCYYGTQVVGAIESTASNTASGTVLPHTITIQLVLA